MEAYEELFEPVIIHNNSRGYDEQVRKRFEEPAWNNPIVRFINARAQDVIPRLSGVWKLGPLVKRSVHALEASKRDVPAWFETLATETSSTRTEGLVLSMYCFWDGEGKLGGFPGVVATEAGFYGGTEVVALRFDPKVIAVQDLVAKAQATGCASRVYATTSDQLNALSAAGIRAKRLEGEPRRAPESDQLRHLSASPLRYLPLTPLQAQRTNADLASGRDGTRWLSPRQIAMIQPLRKAGKLSGLKRPRSLDALAAYETKLIAALR